MINKKKNFYDKKDLLKSSLGKLFENNGPTLPAGNMLMIDRVTNMNEFGGKFNKGFIEAEFDINPNLWFFSCHFINDPVMPGCLGLDAMWQLVGFYLGWIGAKGKGRALGVKNVKFIGQILPNSKKIIYRIHCKKIVIRKLVMGLADGEVFVDKKIIYKASDLKVGLFN